jgi:uncharacterized cofD-like protein
MPAAAGARHGFPPGLRVVALGGGTGLPVVLRALKDGLAECGGSLTGIVTVADDGGSSGRLRRHYNALPMGDIRNCLVALSGNEGLMSRLFQYRYRGQRGLGGHALGNLILTALADDQKSYLKAIETSGQVLAIRGRILPATLRRVALHARLRDGRRVHGESRISKSPAPIERIGIRPALPPAAPGVIAALRAADLIVLGPGSLYTSIIPNLLVRGVAREIARARAPRVLVGNLMTQPGETDGYTPEDHLAAIERAARPGLIDYYLANVRVIRPALRRRYARERAGPVPASGRETLRRHGVALVERDLVREDPDLDKVRHHEGRLARALLAILRMHAIRRAVA